MCRSIDLLRNRRRRRPNPLIPGALIVNLHVFEFMCVMGGFVACLLLLAGTFLFMSEK